MPFSTSDSLTDSVIVHFKICLPNIDKDTSVRSLFRDESFMVNCIQFFTYKFCKPFFGTLRLMKLDSCRFM